MKRLHTIGCAYYRKLWKMQSYGSSKRVSGCQGLEVRKNRQRTEDFKGSKLYNTMMANIYYDICPNPQNVKHQSYTYKYSLWEITVCQCNNTFTVCMNNTFGM